MATNSNTVRTRFIRVLTLLSVILTLTPWYSSGGVTTLGLADSNGRLAAIGAAAGFSLHLLGVRFAWIGAAFAAATSWRLIADVSGSTELALGIGVVATAIAASVAAVLMMWELVASIREATSDVDPSA